VTEPPAKSGGPSPLRVGGLALVGAGAVAALIGLATLLPGGGGSTAPTTEAPSASPSASASATATAGAQPAPGSETAVPVPPSAAVPVPSFPASPTNAIAAPTAAPGAVGTGAGTGAGTGSSVDGSGGGGGGVVRTPVRVYNNSTISGLASRAASDFRADGWQVEQVSNYPSGIIATSTVYFRPGTSEQTAASSLATEFGLRSEPRFSGIDDATPGLIVIVTNDYQRR
jgi:hypothetical protein